MRVLVILAMMFMSSVGAFQPNPASTVQRSSSLAHMASLEYDQPVNISLDALVKLKHAGIKRSIMILLGLGGRALSEQHAGSSAALCNAALPEYLSVLTTSFPRGMKQVEEGFGETGFEPPNARESLRELEQFLDFIDMPNWNRTIFRSDHASNTTFDQNGQEGYDTYMCRFLIP